ncbi:MAG TPA: chemotaxis protein CheB [Magnetospirillaceae bacterium]|jgi:two-component system chemotaxis response regulator CheB
MNTATPQTPPEAIVIGASAGALEALTIILPAIPPTFKLPIFVVVHIPPDRKNVLAELFRTKCRIEVREAEDKDIVSGGTIYFAAPDYHLLIEADKSLSLSADEPILYSRPSIDVLFESAADAFGPGLIAVILTGANQDGANGVKAVAEAGGQVIIQRPDEAFARTMPEAALAVCPAAQALSLDEIAAWLRKM